MLGQSKTVIQAEIDSAAELVDFLRFNALYAKEGVKWQPRSPNPKETVNRLRLRGMEGFVAAVSPFNFTAIGGNLAYTPAMMVCIYVCVCVCVCVYVKIVMFVLSRLSLNLLCVLSSLLLKS